jgi:hypothetical protein
VLYVAATCVDSIEGCDFIVTKIATNSRQCWTSVALPSVGG